MKSYNQPHALDWVSSAGSSIHGRVGSRALSDRAGRLPHGKQFSGTVAASPISNRGDEPAKRNPLKIPYAIQLGLAGTISRKNP